MLEVAGGILLAVANFGRILLGLSVLATVCFAVGALILLVALPAEVRNVILIAAAGIAVVAAFGYWTHVDKRFLIPDDKPGKDQV
jgi:hypothetical protein